MGAGTITITNAFFLGSILETLGSVFLSGEVGIVILPFLSFFIVIKHHHATISFYAYQVQVFCKKYKIKYNKFCCDGIFTRLWQPWPGQRVSLKWNFTRATSQKKSKSLYFIFFDRNSKPKWLFIQVSKEWNDLAAWKKPSTRTCHQHGKI